MMWTDVIAYARFHNIFFLLIFFLLRWIKTPKTSCHFCDKGKAFKGKRPFMGHPGFEPGTYRLKVDCSSAELISHSRLCLGCDEDRCIWPMCLSQKGGHYIVRLFITKRLFFWEENDACGIRTLHFRCERAISLTIRSRRLFNFIYNMSEIFLKIFRYRSFYLK